MIDFHSHILPNVDDGSTSMEETIKIIKEAEQVGFTGIISTSHYLQGYYEFSDEERKRILEKAKMYPVRNDLVPNCPKLYLGSEIYISPDILELIKDSRASTINNTRYVLFELPMNSKPLFVKDVVFKLIQNGYKPIIAHPERYSYVKDDIEYAEELAKMGVLFQANYGSIIGLYGREAKKTLKKLLKNNLISFLGSDVHKVGQIYPHIPKALKKIKKIISEDDVEKLTTLNAQKILNNEEL